MAEKPSGKPSGGGLISNEDALGRFAWMIALLFLVAAFAQAISSQLERFQEVSLKSVLLGYVEPWLLYVYGLSFVVSAVSIVVIFYTRRQIERIVKEEREKLYPQGAEEPLFGGEEQTINPRWARIQDHLEKENEGEWRIAILEADIMLGDMLEAMGYVGDSIGERLKKIETSDFTSLHQAWEAHKIRNQVAHEGSNFHLTEREARRVIGMYRQVFDEFQYV